MANEVQFAFQLGARLSSGFGSTFTNATSTLSKMQSKITSLNKTVKDISGYQKLNAKLAEHKAKLEASGSASVALRQKILDEQASLDKLSNSLRNAGVNMNDLTSEHARLVSQAEHATAAQNQLAEAQARLQSVKQRLSFSNFKGDLLTAGASALAVYSFAKPAMNFEQGMARVQAAARLSQDEMSTLKAEALKWAGATQFSTTEVAASMENLARAGQSAEQIQATIGSVLYMAGAEGMNLADSASIVTNVLGAYRMSAEEATRVTDVLAKGSTLADTNIAGLGEALKTIGPVASGLGISLEDTVAMLDSLAVAGTTGSEAGNALKRGLLQITSNSRAIDQLNKLGIAVKTSQGHLRKMPGFMQELQKKIGGKGAAEQAAILKNIFGAEAIAPMQNLMRAMSSGDYGRFAEELEKSGKAAREMYDTMDSTAQGAFTRLSSALDVMRVKIGTPLLDMLSPVADAFAWLLEKIGKVAEACPELVKAVGAVLTVMSVTKAVSVITRFGTALLELPFATQAVKAAEVAAGVDRIGTAASGAASGVGVLGKAFNNLSLIISAAFAAWEIGKFAVETVSSDLTENQDALAKEQDAAYKRNFLAKAQEELNKSTGFEKDLDRLQEVKYAVEDPNVKLAIQSMQAERQDKTVDTLTSAINEFNKLQNKNPVVRDDVAKNAENIVSAMQGNQEAIKALPPEIKNAIAELNLGDVIANAVKLSVAAAPVAVPTRSVGLNEKMSMWNAALLGTSAAAHATGGIFSSPHVGLVAESGPEAIIPLNDRSRGMPLLERTMSIMGVPPLTERMSGILRSNASTTVNNSPVFNMSFTLNGSATEDDADSLISRVKAAVLDAMREISENESRVSFA